MPLPLTIFLIGVLITASVTGVMKALVIRRKPTYEASFYRPWYRPEGYTDELLSYFKRRKLPNTITAILSFLTLALGINALTQFTVATCPVKVAVLVDVALSCASVIVAVWVIEMRTQSEAWCYEEYKFTGWQKKKRVADKLSGFAVDATQVLVALTAVAAFLILSHYLFSWFLLPVAILLIGITAPLVLLLLSLLWKTLRGLTTYVLAATALYGVGLLIYFLISITSFGPK